VAVALSLAMLNLLLAIDQSPAVSVQSLPMFAESARVKSSEKIVQEPQHVHPKPNRLTPANPGRYNPLARLSQLVADIYEHSEATAYQMPLIHCSSSRVLVAIVPDER